MTNPKKSKGSLFHSLVNSVEKDGSLKTNILASTLDTRTFSQRWADRITEFSGSWAFIGVFTVLCVLWIVSNQLRWVSFDVYPFLFLNWVLTIISTFQNPLILLSQNRQNENDRKAFQEMRQELTEIKQLLKKEDCNDGKRNM